MLTTILFLSLLIPQAPPALPTATAQQITEAAALTLNLEIPVDWKFIALSEPEWRRLTKQFHSLSETAFSIVAARLTYIRDKFVLTASPAKLRATLAHEFGHAVCACLDEVGANYSAQDILRRRLEHPPILNLKNLPR
jgi:hypothetical protein